MSEITQQHVSDPESITLGTTITVIAAFGAVISSLFELTADFSVSSDEAASLSGLTSVLSGLLTVKNKKTRQKSEKEN